MRSTLIDEKELDRYGAEVMYQRCIGLKRELEARFPDLTRSTKPALNSVLSKKAKSNWANPEYRKRQMRARRKNQRKRLAATRPPSVG